MRLILNVAGIDKSRDPQAPAAAPPDSAKRWRPGWTPSVGMGLENPFDDGAGEWGVEGSEPTHPATRDAQGDDGQNRGVEESEEPSELGYLNQALTGEFASNRHLQRADGPAVAPVFHGIGYSLRKSHQNAVRRARAQMETTADPQWRPWIAVDLDGTILADDADNASNVNTPTSSGAPSLGKPHAQVREILKEWVDAGARVSVYTARFGDPEMTTEDLQQTRSEIVDYLDQEGVPFTDVWLGRKPRAHVFIDDRAIPFEGDWNVVQDRVRERFPEFFVAGAGGNKDEERGAEERDASTQQMGPRAGLTGDFLDQKPRPYNQGPVRPVGQFGAPANRDPAGLTSPDKRVYR